MGEGADQSWTCKPDTTVYGGSHSHFGLTLACLNIYLNQCSAIGVI